MGRCVVLLEVASSPALQSHADMAWYGMPCPGDRCRKLRFRLSLTLEQSRNQAPALLQMFVYAPKALHAGFLRENKLAYVL